MSSTASIANSIFFDSRIMIGSPPRRAEAAVAAPRLRREGGDEAEARPQNGNENELRDAIAGVDDDRIRAGRQAAPDRDGDGRRPIGIDEPDRIAEHQPALVAEPAPRQHE